MIVASACSAGVADVGTPLTLLHRVSFDETIGVMREVRVVEDEIPVGVQLINRGAGALTVEELDNLAVSSRKNRSFSGRHDVDRVVHAAFRAGLIERINQLIGAHTRDGDDQVYLPDEVCFFG